ncbi:MAG: hypothetical protein Ta2C_10810 [Candidatus Endomicrobiellum trichonymphae]|uniref:hypothetical protein n=1 Tax=Endomicrobium trichonymphae TaxID=1408204 RepID=UPI0027D3E56B|nr:MAG: hypothetical protein Ta2C_10810 [Candidatus Endomicrobium trichonymphae]
MADTKKEDLKTPEDIKKWYAARQEELKQKKSALLKELQTKNAAHKSKRRKSIDHAKFILAGECLKYPEITKKLLENLSKNEHNENTAQSLTWLAEDLGLTDLKFKVKDKTK